MQNEIIDIQFLRSLAPFTNRATAISKLQSLTWSVGKPAVATYKVGSETRGLLAIGIADGVGKCRVLADDEDFQTLKVYTEALNKKVDDYIEVTDAWKEVVDAWRSVTDDRLVELEGKSHVQNTDTGTTSPTFQVDSTSNGPKLKGKGGDLELRNAGDTDYAGLTLGNITIKGNVTQEGDTFISQAETVEINDNLLLINKGEVGAGVTKGIAGIEIDRGTLPNYQIVFDESDKRFKAGEVGNIWPLALRDEETNMVDGMFVTWDSATKRLKTTNTVPSNRKLFFTDSNSYLQLMSHDFSGTTLVQTLTYTNAKGSLFVSAGDSNLNLDTDKTNFRFYKNLIVPSSIDAGTDMILKRNGTTKLTLKDTVAQFTVPVTATTFNRTSDGSEALYHADIIDDLVTGGTSKVLSAEQGKILSTKVNEIGDTYLPLSAGSGKHVTGDLYLDQKIYMKTLKPIYVQDSKGNYMQALQGATLDGEEVIQLGASSKIRVESVTDFSKAVKFKDTVTLGTNSKLYYEVSSSSSRTILDPAGGNIVLGNVNVQDMKFSTAAGKDLYHLEGTTPYKIWTAHSFDPDSKANRVNPVVEQTLTLNMSTTGYKVKLGVDDTGYPGMFVSTQAGVSKSSLYYSPKSDAWEIFTGTQSGVIATQNWVIDQVPTIFYARGFEVRKLNAAVNLDSDLLYGGAAANYSDLTYWTNAPEGFSYGTVYQLGLQDYTSLNAQLAFDIIHTSDTDQKTNHLWFRTSGKAGYGVAGWKRVVTADELEGYVPSGDLTNYYTKTQSDARYWTKTELVDPATKSGNNTFTGTNSFTAGKFNVGPFNVTATGSLLIDMINTGGWERSIMWSNNSAPASRIRFGSYGNADVAKFAWIGVGDVQYNTAQYRFYGTSMRVPSVWSLDDAGGNSLVWTQSTQLAHFGRAIGTTKIRSGNVDLIHTKGTADYKILDESNWESIIPNAKWTYGFVGMQVGSANQDLNTILNGDNNIKAVLNYYQVGALTNAPTGMSYGSVFQLYTNAFTSYGSEVLKPQLAFDINHNVAGSTRYMYFRTANNLGYGDSSNWKRVVTADEKPAGYVLDENSHPALKSIEDGTTLTWLRAPQSGFIPFTAVNIANGGSGSLGTSTWTFKDAYIANVSANRYLFGNTGVDFRLDTNNKIAATISGSARGIEIGDLLVSSNYGADAVKVPTNGIFASGRIQSNDSMLVGYSGNVIEGMLGYGLYYDGTFAQGLGSEYSSGALVLYKMLNPNKGKAGYNVPRAATGTPTYLKISSGYLTLGVGENKAYTAGEAVTVTEYTVLHQGNGFYLGVPTTYVPVRMPADKAALATGSGYLEWWNSGAGWVNHRAGKYIVNGGSSSQFLKGDGSLDSTAYYPNVGRGFFSFDSAGRPLVSNNQGYSARDKDGTAREIMWLGTDNTMYLGNTSTNTTIPDIVFRYGEGHTLAVSAIASQSWATTQLAKYLLLTGGTVSGSLTISPVGSAGFAVNNADTSGVDVIQTFRVKGANKFLLGWSDSGGGAFMQRSDNNRCMVLMSDGLYTGSSLGNVVRVATLTDLAGYLPLTGGTMTGSIDSTANQILRYTHNSGTHSAISVTKDNPGYISVGNYSSGMRVFLLTNDSDVLHYVSTNKVNGVNYRMWDARNLDKPLRYASGGTAGNYTSVYDRNLNVNGTGWTFLSATNATTTSIFAPTSVGTSGQILQSSGTGAPVWANVSTVMDGYLPLSGGIMTGAIQLRTQKIMAWAQGQVNQTILESDGNNSYLGMGAGTTYIKSGAYDLYHDTGMASYKIWDENNLQFPVISTSTRRVRDIQVVDSLPTTQASGVLYLVVK